MVRDLPEILLPQPEERGAVELRVAADVVVRVGMERLAVLVLPDLLRVVLGLDVHGARAPVVLLAPDVVAPFEQEDAFSGWRDVIGERSAAGARADDDHVVMSHESSLRSQPNTQRPTRG